MNIGNVRLHLNLMYLLRPILQVIMLYLTLINMFLYIGSIYIVFNLNLCSPFGNCYILHLTLKNRFT